MVINCEITLDDMLAFQYHSVERKKTSSGLYLGLLLIFVGIVSVVACVQATAAHGWTAILSHLAATFLGFVCLGLGWMIVRADREVRRLARPTLLSDAARKRWMSMPSITSGLGPTRITIDSAGISEEQTMATTTYRWRAVERVVDSPDHIVLMRANRTGIIIPKRSVPDPAAALDLIGKLRETASQGPPPLPPAGVAQ